jgi:serine/threonine protein kinase
MILFDNSQLNHPSNAIIINNKITISDSTTAATDPQIPSTVSTTVTNTINIGSGKYVYKIYDRRFREYWHLVKFSRSHELSLEWIPNCEIVLNVDNQNLVIIQYPFMEGNHLPHNVHQVALLVKQLNDFHSKGLVHADIRASNLIFHETRAMLIDYDFAGEAGKVIYPLNFNLQLLDGKRHPDVKPREKAYQSHDCFSLAAVLRLMKLESTSQEENDWWYTIIDLIEQQKLQDCLQLLSLVSDSEKINLYPIDTEFYKYTSATGISPSRRVPKEKRPGDQGVILIPRKRSKKN